MALPPAMREAGDGGGAGEEYPASVFAPYDRRQLRALRERLRAAAGGAPASALALSAVPEPGLYALAAALAGESGESGGRGELAARLRAELRTRNCRGMGVDPVGAVRRGRLLQLIGSFTTLRVAGVSSLQRRRMRGGCPLCGEADSLRVSLSVWRGGSASLADAAAGCWSLPRSCWRKATDKDRRPYSPALSLSFRSFRRGPATGRPLPPDSGNGRRFQIPGAAGMREKAADDGP